MTNRKFSRKRIGQALGLLALGLVLLFGSAGYGADFGRTGGDLLFITAAQETAERVLDPSEYSITRLSVLFFNGTFLSLTNVREPRNATNVAVIVRAIVNNVRSTFQETMDIVNGQGSKMIRLGDFNADVRVEEVRIRWTAAQQEQESATFEVEAVVNARGGLEVRLTAIPGSPTLSIQFVVRGDTKPHRLVDPGTPILILGIAKEGVTAFRSAEDIASLMFFATVPKATAASTDSTMQGPTQLTFLFAELTTLILAQDGRQIRTPQNKVLLVQDDKDDPPPVQWDPPAGYFGCCESKLELVRIVQPSDDKDEKKERLDKTPVGRRVVEGGDTKISIEFDVAIQWECKRDVNINNLCRGAFTAQVSQRPGNPKPKGESITVSKISSEPDVRCQDAKDKQSATLRVTYTATYEGNNAEVKAGQGGAKHLLITIFVSGPKSDKGIQHSVKVQFDTKRRDDRGRFPVSVPPKPTKLPEPKK